MEEVKIEGETGADSFQDTLLSGQLTEFFPWNRMILSCLNVLNDQHASTDFLEIEKLRMPLYVTYSPNKKLKILAKIIEKLNFEKNFLYHFL